MESGDFPVPVLFLKFGENHGEDAKDSSPEGNDGDIEGASWAKGILGPGLSFDGVDNYLKAVDSASLDIEDAITLLAWIKVTDATAANRIICKPHTSWVEPFLMYCLWVRLESLGFGISDGSTRTYARRGIILDDTWHHVAGTYDGSTMRWYVDGTQVGFVEVELTLSTNDEDVYIGQTGKDGSWFKGVIDEVRIYDVALTAQQIRELYYGFE